MRVLVCTQAVDQDDRVLGFFHRWIEDLARYAERVEVICLSEGRHALPENVRVHSLGKENGRSRTKYIVRFFRYVWSLRGEYDAVFVHMNQEYVLMGGVLWRALGKRVVLWRNHKIGTRLTDLACRMANIVCHTSPDAYVTRFVRARRMPIGVDTSIFRIPAKPAPFDTVLFLGRLDPVKKPDVFLAAVDLMARKGIHATVHGYGDPTDSDAPHVAAIRESILRLEDRGAIRWFPGISHDETPGIYASHGIYVNITPSGSFDKTIGEAMASGCIVVAANKAIRGVIPDQLLVEPDSFQDVARGIEAALMLQEDEREAVVRRSAAFIENEHSLKALIGGLVKLLR